MVCFENVTVIENEATILNQLDLKVNHSERVALTGHSGSGKTSLLLTLLGVYKPSSGKVIFDGQELSAKTIVDIRKKIAYVSQEPVLGAETVMEAMYLPFKYKTNSSIKPSHSQLVSVIEKLKLKADILEKTSDIVSGGEKQRLAIARCLLLGKHVFLLDEVTSALDPESKQAVIELFSQPEYTILSVSHDPEWIKCCSYEVNMKSGQIISTRRNS